MQSEFFGPDLNNSIAYEAFLQSCSFSDSKLKIKHFVKFNKTCLCCSISILCFCTKSHRQ